MRKNGESWQIMTEINRLEKLTNYLNINNIDGFIIPCNDAFQSEYVPTHAKRLEWLTGFTGSNGLAVVLASGKTAFFTDGRYTIQAKSEVPSAFEHYNLASTKPWEWLKENASGKVIHYDAWLHTEDNLSLYQSVNSIRLSPCKKNPIDAIWKNKPIPESYEIVEHPLEFSGRESSEKINDVQSLLADKKADYLLLTAPDSICWLLNIRGSDVPCAPLVLAYALVSRKGDVELFTESAKPSKTLANKLEKTVVFTSTDTLPSRVKELNKKNIILDKSSTPVWFPLNLNKEKLHYVSDPCQLAKAKKNPVEVKGTKAAHIRDGIALTKGLIWIEEQLKKQKQIKETDVSDKLIELRKEQQHFKEPSFGTIAGFNSNGAIVHYQPQKATAAMLDSKAGSMLLLDSGGQYLDGTTDITRTIALGKPSKEQKQMFTLVLKGHIALATAVFPRGTTGSALDSYARQFLWEQGLDFDHGTGHGVGSYLSVHEGPQRISKLPNKVVLEAGMVISNEPGFYKNNEYGIRIESLILVSEHTQFNDFLSFETISYAPIDLALIDKKLLTKKERGWLNGYHKQVLEMLAPKLSSPEYAWLKKKTHSI